MIQIDNSMLQDILSCSTRAWVKYVQHKWIRDQDPKASERMVVGNLFHRMFERCLLKQSVSENLTLFGETYYIAFPAGVAQEKYILENLLVLAQVWLRDLNTYFKDYDVLATEQTLHMGLSPEVTFFGTPDAVLENEHGIWIVDNKTTGWLSEEKKRFWARGSQGMGYWELVEQCYGKEPRGILWNVLEIGKIPPYDGNLTKKCHKHRVKYAECQALHVSKMMIGPVTYTARQLENWRAQALSGAVIFQDISEIETSNADLLKMEGQFTYPGCSACGLTDWCWGGRNSGMMQSMMEEYLWPRNMQQDSGA